MCLICVVWKFLQSVFYFLFLSLLILLNLVIFFIATKMYLGVGAFIVLEFHMK